MKKIFIFILLVVNLIANTENKILNEANIKKINGDATEYLMHKVFTKNGWRRIPSEVGVNGIDGLYVKYDKYGNIIDVMVSEAKYNTSTLGYTQNKSVRQMSKKWILDNIDLLMKSSQIKQNPALLAQYSQIKKHIQNGNYKARLFHLTISDNYLKPSLYKISEMGEVNILKNSLVGRENYKINNMLIDITNPKNRFEAQIVEYFTKGRINSFIKFAKKNNIPINEKIFDLLRKNIKIDEYTLNKIIAQEYELTKAIKNFYQYKNSIAISKYRLKFKTRTFWQKAFRVVRRIK